MTELLNMESFAKTLNNATYTDYFYRLMMIARSVYKWENLPNGINEKHIEKYLFSEGSCVFFHDKKYGYMVTKCLNIGALNAYDEPTQIEAYATGYQNMSLENNENCVMICNNDLMLPTTNTLQLFAYRLAEATRTSDVNVTAQKTPYFVICEEKQKLSFKTAMRKVLENEPAVYGMKGFEKGAIDVLKMGAPVVFDKLTLHKHEIWNEAMTFLGLNNANQDKKERLVADEVSANNEQVGASGNVFLKARLDAVERINEMFDLNIKVSMREMPTPKLSEGSENNVSELRTEDSEVV